MGSIPIDGWKCHYAAVIAIYCFSFLAVDLLGAYQGGVRQAGTFSSGRGVSGDKGECNKVLEDDGWYQTAGFVREREVKKRRYHSRYGELKPALKREMLQ